VLGKEANNFVKVVAWYDNEWGYSVRTADLAAFDGEVLVSGLLEVGMFDKKLVTDIDVKGKQVLVRVDFNVPIKAGKVEDDTRIRAALPTIKYLLDQGAAVILCSHLGRPKEGPDPQYSMAPTAEHLSRLLGRPVSFSEECVGPAAEKAARRSSRAIYWCWKIPVSIRARPRMTPRWLANWRRWQRFTLTMPSAPRIALTPRRKAWLIFFPVWRAFSWRRRSVSWSGDLPTPNDPSSPSWRR